MNMPLLIVVTAGFFLPVPKSFIEALMYGGMVYMAYRLLGGV